MPRGLEKAEEPQPPVPIRLRADNCTRPWGSHPNKLRREVEGEAPDRVKVIFQSLTESRLMTLDKPGCFMDC